MKVICWLLGHKPVVFASRSRGLEVFCVRCHLGLR